VIKTVDFSKYSSIKCGPATDVHVITSKNDVPKDAKIIGLANNVLIHPCAKNLALLSKEFDYIKIVDNKLFIGAATPSGKIVSFCKKEDIGGFEFLSALPGSLGGLLKMNAGLLGYEIFDLLHSIDTHKATLNKDKIPHGYRNAQIDGVVFEAVFSIQKGFDDSIVDFIKQKRKNQPKQPSAGSCFKNPPNDFAGRLIEAVGLKGYQKGGFAFSEKHANFLINTGGGKYEDAIWLINEAKKRVFETFGVLLEEEIDIVKA
jgi:UDP-N-acetylmuramate dehydrogenase